MITAKLPWSESLISQTREAIEEIRVDHTGYLHFKHTTLGFGRIELNDLVSSELRLQLKDTKDLLIYENPDKLIAAGWVID